MNKPAQIRAVLEAALPYLKRDPENLLVFIENGRVASSLGRRGWEYRYTVTVGLLDFAGHPDTVILPLLDWIRSSEPALLQNRDSSEKAIEFEAEIRNNRTCDLMLKIPLTERVMIDVEEGITRANHLDEPCMMPTVDRLQVYLKGDLIYDSRPA